LRFISPALRRTISTPHAARFARLELGLYTKSAKGATFCEFVNNKGGHLVMPAFI
jgi:hypothetical protein